MSAQGPVARALSAVQRAQQKAYGDWLLHAEQCYGCRAAEKPSTGCDTGRDLWRIYRDARIAPVKGTA